MRLWFRFLPLLRPYRGRLAVTFVATLARPLLNAAKIYLLKIIIDQLAISPQLRTALFIGGAFLAIALAKGVANFGDQYLGAYIGGRIVLDLRQQLFARLLRLSHRYHAEHRVGESISRLISDTGAVEDLVVAGITDGLTQVLTILIFGGMLIYLDPALAAIALLILPALFGALYIYGRRSRDAFRDVRVRLAELTASAEEPLANVALVKTFMRHAHEEQNLYQRGMEHWQARLRAVRQRAIFSPLGDIVATVGTVLVVIFSTNALLTGALTIGGLVIFLAYLGQMYAPLLSLSRLGNNLQGGLAAAERIASILDAPATADEPYLATRTWRTLTPAEVASEPAIVFDHVTFGFTANKPILQDFSLQIPQGALVAVVGPSGGGKSTALALLQRFYDPDAGTIRLFGHDLREVATTQLRQMFAVVPQEAALLQGTVRDNIAYGQLDASDDTIQRVLSVVDWPGDRLMDLVGPRGTKVSGGQRQRIAIARALVRAAPVLVFDEATSALDSLAEERLRQTLAAMRGRQTVLLVAHRLATAHQADMIVVVDRGRVVEVGKHDHLMAHNGLYAQLVHAQNTSPTTSVDPVAAAVTAPHAP